MDKKQSRLRRARKPRSKMRELGVHRLSVHRTAQHIYAQVISPEGGQANLDCLVFVGSGDDQRPDEEVEGILKGEDAKRGHGR